MRKHKAERLWRDFLLERFSRKGLFSRPVVPEFEWGIYGESTGKVRGGGSSWDGAVPCQAVYIAYILSLPQSRQRTQSSCAHFTDSHAAGSCCRWLMQMFFLQDRQTDLQNSSSERPLWGQGQLLDGAMDP